MSSMNSSEGLPFTLVSTPTFKTGKDDQYTRVATEMALIHNCIIRGFNTLYVQALEVQPHEYKDFISYAHACCLAIEAHHMGEETIAFPAIEEATGVKGIMDENIAQHQAFIDGLHKLSQYTNSFLSGIKPIDQFSSRQLREMIDTFSEALNKHLHDEIPTLLALSSYGDALDLQGIVKKEADSVIANLSKTAVMPAVLLNHDVTFEGGIHSSFPPIPWPIKWILMNICTLWNWRWWQWSSCDPSGRPRAPRASRAQT